jgi:hypothetical protein
MRFAICHEILQGWKLEDVITCSTRIGYMSVEIAPELQRIAPATSSSKPLYIMPNAIFSGFMSATCKWTSGEKSNQAP